MNLPLSGHQKARDSGIPTMSVPVVPNEGEQSVILRDALRMAMTMSSENISKDDMTSHQQDTQLPLNQSLQPRQTGHETARVLQHSRSSSPSAGSATPLSLSLSTPASPVSLSSVPASMALSMDLDSDTDMDMDMETDMDTSTTWSLYGSSGEDSRAGSPAVRSRRDAGGPNSRESDGMVDPGETFRRRLEPDEAESRVDSPRIGRVPSAFPYPISRRNTATIPSLIRRSTSTTVRAREDTSQSHSGSFESDITTTTTTRTTAGNDTHSRSHWAVQESLDRQRYQGDLFDLVLPVLDLPGASVSTTMADSDRRFRPETDDVTASKRHSTIRPMPTTSVDNEKTREQGGTSSSALSMVLCGTNRTTNTFLRELLRDSRFEVYKFPSSSSRLGASTPGPRTGATRNQNNASSRSSQPQSGRVDGKDAKSAYYTVGVYAVDSPAQGASRSAAEGKKLVARIKVFGKGQYSNLDNVSFFVSRSYRYRHTQSAYTTHSALL